jgi:hypothetical protein
MIELFRSPILVGAVSLVAFSLAAAAGYRLRYLRTTESDDYALVVGGTLTLVGLIIAFTFSMAVGRYDQRKIYEEQEANAIGTEYVRADLLPPEKAAQVRTLLRGYLDQRIQWYTERDAERLRHIDAETARLQGELWAAVATHASNHETPVAALVAAGMNGVLDAQGLTQSAWWNQIPQGAWLLLTAISLFCNLLIGSLMHDKSRFFTFVMPLALAITLFLIADIDAPRNGTIRVHPQNLESTAASLAH